MAPLEREPGQNPYDVNGLQTLLSWLPHREDGAREPPPAEAVWQALVEVLTVTR